MHPHAPHCLLCPVTELTEYAADVDVSFAREAIRAVGQIALKCYDVNGIVDRLLQFLEMETDYVTAETLVSADTFPCGNLGLSNFPCCAH